jgi:hypothetical protein
MARNSKHTETVKSYDDTFLDCRDLRHTWRVVGYYRRDGVVRRVIECVRGCGTQRVDNWKRDGQRLQPVYSYANGYQVEGGMDTYEVRREVMRRATIFASEKAMVEALTASGKPRVKRGK